MAAFNVISMKLKEMYQMITLGGDAELEPVDSHDPFLDGIVFSVRPPRKSWKVGGCSRHGRLGVCMQPATLQPLDASQCQQKHACGSPQEHAQVGLQQHAPCPHKSMSAACPWQSPRACPS
eukprot:361311-Chlamydomonas_euryale.AAC.6